MGLNITLSPSDLKFKANEGDQILDTALLANINLPYSCKNGSCGSCKSLLISGDVEHLDDCEGVSLEERKRDLY